MPVSSYIHWYIVLAGMQFTEAEMVIFLQHIHLITVMVDGHDVRSDLKIEQKLRYYAETQYVCGSCMLPPGVFFMGS